jgi:hypothetical protein
MTNTLTSAYWPVNRVIDIIWWMLCKILILTNLLMIALVGCASEQLIAPNPANEEIITAWRRDQHAVWELDWPAAPIGGPLTAEVWHAGERYRYEILESAAPALVGQTLIFDGQTGWRYSRFETEAPEKIASPRLSPVSDAFTTIDRLLETSPMTAARQEDTTLNYGPTEKMTLAYENGDGLTVWIDPETELVVRLTFQVGGNQATLKARRNEPLTDFSEEIFKPDAHIRR